MKETPKLVPHSLYRQLGCKETNLAAFFADKSLSEVSSHVLFLFEYDGTYWIGRDFSPDNPLALVCMQQLAKSGVCPRLVGHSSGSPERASDQVMKGCSSAWRWHPKQEAR